MPKGKVVGIKPYSFKDEKTGNQISGKKVFVESKISVPGGIGVEIIFFNLSTDREKKVIEGASTIEECFEEEIYFGLTPNNAIDLIKVI
jgi:hypothetical protein